MEQRHVHRHYKVMTPDRHDIPIIGDFYTKAEVDAMVAEAVEEARRID